MPKHRPPAPDLDSLSSEELKDSARQCEYFAIYARAKADALDARLAGHDEIASVCEDNAKRLRASLRREYRW